MNRVYKVIWSKAKHCYVVTSEIAKNHGGKAASAGMKSMMAALIAAMALTGAYIPANAADSVKDSVSANTELTLFLNAIAEGSYDAVEMAVEEGKETAALPAGQHTVYDENGFYVKQSTNQTYNSLTKDGLWVGGA